MQKSILIALVMWVAFPALAIEPIMIEGGEEPGHLVPVAPRCDPYTRLLTEKLLVTPSDYGRMVFRPSFEGEWAVSVYGIDPAEDSRKSQAFRMTLTKAKTSLYFSLPENNDGLKARKPVEVTRVDVNISRDFAIMIQRAWATMLLKTKYPSKASGGLDGYTAEFSVFVLNEGNIYGETWTPHQGLPKELVELGFSLATYCESPEEARLASQEKITGQLAAFTERAK